MLHARALAISLFFAVIVIISCWPAHSTPTSTLRRITSTTEEGINLNPSISDDGHQVAFESSEDITGLGDNDSFRAFRADMTHEPTLFAQIGQTRAVTPAVSRDGSQIAFASNEDLVGNNPDRNAEIFLFDGSSLKQITNTTPEDTFSRISDGNFQPSITNDGRFIAFASNRDLVGLNPDLNLEVFLFDRAAGAFSQITSSEEAPGSWDAKISGDGSHLVYITNASPTSGDSRDLLLRDLPSGTTTLIASRSAALSLSYGRAISNDGSRVVYSANTAENQSQVFLFDARIKAVTQITLLGTRTQDVPLHPTISGDGKRVAFATRRKVENGSNDGGVELYLYDIPTAQFSQLTSAPANATAEVVSSLDNDGTTVAFNFARVLSGPVSSSDLANNSEIYAINIPPRQAFGALTVLNGAALGNERAEMKSIAPGSIAIARGSGLARRPLEAQALASGLFPFSVDQITVHVNGQPAQLLYVSPTQINFVVPADTPGGPAEIVATNADAFASKTTVPVLPSAPGLFTISGDGRGEALVLNADSLLAGPFDPTDNKLRLNIFATGIHSSTAITASIGGRDVPVESVIQSGNLPGLDELHVIVPSELRGAGTSDLIVYAEGNESNPTTITLSGSSQREIVINEILADPPDGAMGDANQDGIRDSSQDEFVEFVNTTTRDLDLGGYEVLTRGAGSSTDVLRHRFAPDVILSAGAAILLFGGGTPEPANVAFGGAHVFKASTGGLSLQNTGSTVTLRDSHAQMITFLSYGGSSGLRGDANQSLSRSPDITGTFVLHQSASLSGGSVFSAGTRLNGDPFLPNPAISQILISPLTAILHSGEQVQFNGRAIDEANSPVNDVIFTWQSNDVSIVTIDRNGLAKAVGSGTAQIVASARGVRSSASALTVFAVSPTPTPVSSPTASPTPNATPSPTARPSPTASPTPFPPIVISEFRTRGPNGASDEFVELYNNSNTPIDLSGWKIRSSSNAGGINTRLTISAGTRIPAHSHFLAINSAGYSGSVSGDELYTSSIANDGGLALTLPDETVVDQVGMSSGSAFKEGIHLAPLPSDANQSYERKPGGVSGSSTDTNDNFSDFQLLTPADPQNLASSPTPGSSPTPSPSPSPSPSSSRTPSPEPSPSPIVGLVISQIYGGGGNSGAPFRNDFIEIFNSGGTTVTLTGWSVQYSGASGITWAVTSLSSVSLAPGQYYLVQEASGGSAGADLPTADLIGTISMAASAGKVALVNTITPISGSCPGNNSIIDLVGYGTATCFRGIGPAAAPSNTTAAIRNNHGCSNTENNANDFIVAPPNPRNINTTINVCSETTTIGVPAAARTELLIWISQLLGWFA